MATAISNIGNTLDMPASPAETLETSNAAPGSVLAETAITQELTVKTDKKRTRRGRNIPDPRLSQGQTAQVRTLY